MKPWKRDPGSQPERGVNCFNGATAMKPWKSIGLTSHRLPYWSLQWGHGDEAVEENVESVGCGDQCDASMGPRRRSRGRATPRERGWETTGSFNGATAMKPWKSPASRRSVPRGTGLQWGHGDEAVEEPDRRRHVAAKKARFNGATAMKPWKTRKGRRSGRVGPDFNGATAMKLWKTSSATNEPRNACPSFRLDPQWSGYGPILPQARRENRSRIGKGRPAGSIELRVSPSPSKIPYGGFSPVAVGRK